MTDIREVLADGFSLNIEYNSYYIHYISLTLLRYCYYYWLFMNIIGFSGILILPYFHILLDISYRDISYYYLLQYILRSHLLNIIRILPLYLKDVEMYYIIFSFSLLAIVFYFHILHYTYTIITQIYYWLRWIYCLIDITLVRYIFSGLLIDYIFIFIFFHYVIDIIIINSYI